MLIAVENYPLGDGDKAKSISAVRFPYILSVFKKLCYLLKTWIEFLILCVCVLSCC